MAVIKTEVSSPTSPGLIKELFPKINIYFEGINEYEFSWALLTENKNDIVRDG